MNEIINGYNITYRIGDPWAEVRKIGYIDEFHRLRGEVLVFRGTWNECIQYAKEN